MVRQKMEGRGKGSCGLLVLYKKEKTVTRKCLKEQVRRRKKSFH